MSIIIKIIIDNNVIICYNYNHILINYINIKMSKIQVKTQKYTKNIIPKDELSKVNKAVNTAYKPVKQAKVIEITHAKLFVDLLGKRYIKANAFSVGDYDTEEKAQIALTSKIKEDTKENQPFKDLHISEKDMTEAINKFIAPRFKKMLKDKEKEQSENKVKPKAEVKVDVKPEVKTENKEPTKQELIMIYYNKNEKEANIQVLKTETKNLIDKIHNITGLDNVQNEEFKKALSFVKENKTKFNF